jgi:hypothetical protein
MSVPGTPACDPGNSLLAEVPALFTTSLPPPGANGAHPN